MGAVKAKGQAPATSTPQEVDSPHKPATKSAGHSPPDHSGLTYVSRDDLKPLEAPPSDRSLANPVVKLGAAAAENWSAQFAALDDVRRVALFAPKALLSGGAQGGRLRQIVECTVTLVESL